MYDFHMHSTYSDGLLPPEVLVRKAAENHLKAIAITDHNNTLTDGDWEALGQSCRGELQLVKGCEISTIYTMRQGQKKEIHVVALCFDSRTVVNGAGETFRERILRNNPDNSGYVNEIVRKLHLCGVEVPRYDELRVLYHDCRHIGRTQIADCIVKRGYADSLNAAFDRYIGDFGDRLAHVDALSYSHYIEFAECIQMIQAAGGIPILAHPLKYHFDEEEMARFLNLFLQSSKPPARGIEVFYGKYTREQQCELKEIADGYHLYYSSASDWHSRFGEKDRLMTADHLAGCDLRRHIVSCVTDVFGEPVLQGDVL